MGEQQKKNRKNGRIGKLFLVGCYDNVLLVAQLFAHLHRTSAWLTLILATLGLLWPNRCLRMLPQWVTQRLYVLPHHEWYHHHLPNLCMLQDKGLSHYPPSNSRLQPTPANFLFHSHSLIFCCPWQRFRALGTDPLVSISNAFHALHDLSQSHFFLVIPIKISAIPIWYLSIVLALNVTPITSCFITLWALLGFFSSFLDILEVSAPLVKHSGVIIFFSRISCHPWSERGCYVFSNPFLCVLKCAPRDPGFLWSYQINSLLHSFERLTASGRPSFPCLFLAIYRGLVV